MQGMNFQSGDLSFFSGYDGCQAIYFIFLLDMDGFWKHVKLQVFHGNTAFFGERGRPTSDEFLRARIVVARTDPLLI